MKLFTACVTLLSLLLVSCASRSVRAQSQGEPVFSIETKNPEDQVNLQAQAGTALIEIQSPSGIGATTFTLESGVMPEQITIQLHVSGLEEFQLISAHNTIAASVSSSAGVNAQSQRKISGNSEQPLRSSDAFWLKIKVISDSQSIPLSEAGYFEIDLPEEFIQQTGKTFEIQWIDFYR